MYKLLIVEDEENIRQGLCNLFPWEEIGFCITGECTNGREALDYLAKNNIDVVLTDIRLPVLDGIALARAIHEHHPDTAVVFLSGYKDFEYAQQAIKYGVKDYLVKPVKYNELVLSFLSLKETLNAKSVKDASSEALEKSPENESYYDWIISTVKNYVKNNIKTAALEDAAVSVNLSGGYLSRLFKEKMGINFIDYCTRVRMEYASRMLVNSSYKTYEVADMVGYDNPKNFTRAFKQFYNITPREMREKGKPSNEA